MYLVDIWITFGYHLFIGAQPAVRKSSKINGESGAVNTFQNNDCYFIMTWLFVGKAHTVNKARIL